MAISSRFSSSKNEALSPRRFSIPQTRHILELGCFRLTLKLMNETGDLNRGFVNLAFQAMDLPPDPFQLDVIMGGQGLIPFFLQHPDFLFYLGLVQSHHFVLLVLVDIQGLAESIQEMLLVQLTVPLDRFMVGFLGDFPQFGNRFFLEFFVGVGHDLSSLSMLMR
jgi:hypothetical protein